jgi:hypothetical protein
VVGPFVAAILAAQRKGYDTDNLKMRARAVADKFFPLIVTPSLGELEYADAISEINRQTQEIVRLTNLPTPIVDVGNQDELKWCRDDKMSTELSREQLHDLILNTRYVHGIVAGLFEYVDNIDAAIKIFTKAIEIENIENDMNVTSGLAELRYRGRNITDKLDDKRFSEISNLLNKALLRAEFESKKVTEFQVNGGTGLDATIRTRLIERYKRAVLFIKLEIALFLAQEGEQWSTANEYADEIYRGLQPNVIQLECIDSYGKVDIMDTYAFVKLASQAYNVQTYDERPDVMEVRRLRSILMDAKAQLKQLSNRLAQAADQRNSAPGKNASVSCFADEERNDLWNRRVSGHIRLADALLSR